MTDPRLASPGSWQAWPVLHLARRRHGRQERGLLVDALHAFGITGLSATVFKAQGGTETYDTPEEIHAAGWRVAA